MRRFRMTIRMTAVGGILAMAALALTGGLAGCRSASSVGIHPAGDSFFPLAQGNEWLFAAVTREREVIWDTVRIDAVTRAGGHSYYRLRAAWPGFSGGLWLRRDAGGDLLWTGRPGENEQPLLMFDAAIGERWGTGAGLHQCLEWLVMHDNYAAVATPFHLFDGARTFGGTTNCTDFGWGVSAARGIGPVMWTETTIAGLREWRLVNAEILDDKAAGGASRVVNGS